MNEKAEITCHSKWELSEDFYLTALFWKVSWNKTLRVVARCFSSEENSAELNWNLKVDLNYIYKRLFK